MAKKWGKCEKSVRFYFPRLQNHMDGGCSYDLKRHLLLGRIAMTNLDSILKSRATTVPMKVHMVKAVVFMVVMYGCENWTIKKTECQRVKAFELVLKKALDSTMDYKIKPVNPKGSQS